MRATKALIVTAAMGFYSLSLASTLRADEEDKDLYSLVLIGADLVDAKRDMTIFDRNEDGFIDAKEQQRLSWKKEVTDYDLNKDGKLAADEWAAASLPRDGKEFDEDGDKRLSLMELATLLAKHRMELGLTTADQAQARQLVRMMDMNQDGKISREESQRAEGFGVQRSELGDYDANKDGNITLAEVENVLARQRKEKGYNATHFSEAQKILLRLDRNRSNYLESDELADEPGPGELPANQFKVIDLDDDQRLDIDELARHLAKEEK